MALPHPADAINRVPTPRCNNFFILPQALALRPLGGNSKKPVRGCRNLAFSRLRHFGQNPPKRWRAELPYILKNIESHAKIVAARYQVFLPRSEGYSRGPEETSKERICMDPNLLAILLGLVTNGLTSLIAKFGHKSKELLIGKDFLEKWELEKTSLEPILQHAITNVEEHIEWKAPPSLEVTCSFLLTPEVEAIVRQIYSANIQTARKRSNIDAIRKEFLASFSLYTGLEKDQLAAPSKNLFGALLEGCSFALDKAIDKGILAAHEAQSAFRHRIILDELSTIRKNLALLTAKSKPDVTSILAFEEKFRQQVIVRHAYITPPYLDTAPKLPIENLYVSPRFTPAAVKDESSDTLTLPEFLSQTYRVVVLGNPGGGKSTLARKLCSVLATEDARSLLGERKQITPILVVLREYGAEKKNRNWSILQFIEAKANTTYQLHPPASAFEYLLLNGRALVIFDGLDELLDSTYRQEISSDVELFCTLYPSVPVVVTSREVGYEQAPLDENMFRIFHLAAFDSEQVREYATKWFNADLDLTSEEKQQKIKNFLDESRFVPDLQSNPLMLALICNIYRGENYIPKNRPELYEKCATMLFERWDKSRGIAVPLPFEPHINPAMKYLAHWIYSDDVLRGGVTERRLIEKAADYLCQRRFEDRDEAEYAARDFIEFCRGRAWVFTDTGTTKDGEPLYQFTHQTFLEYFTAAYLVRTNPTPETLSNVLLPRIAKREWDVVAQLAIQLQSKNLEGAAEELLATLLNKAPEFEENSKWNILSFAARCLGFLVPSPQTTREVTLACFTFDLNYDAKSALRDALLTPLPTPGPGQKILEPLLYELLLSTTAENRVAIATAIEKEVLEIVNRGEVSLSLKALYAGLNLHLIPLSKLIFTGAADFWRDTSKRIFDSCAEKLPEFYPKCLWLSVIALWRGKVGIIDLIQWFGIDKILPENVMTIPFQVNNYGITLADELIMDSFGAFSPNYNRSVLHVKDVRAETLAEELVSVLIAYPTPWIKFDPSKSIDLFQVITPGSGKYRTATKMKAQTLFSIFVLTAVALEKLGAQMIDPSQHTFTGQSGYGAIRQAAHPLLQYFGSLLLARLEPIDAKRVQAEMEKCGFIIEQQEFIWKWIRKEVNFVEVDKKHVDPNFLELPKLLSTHIDIYLKLGKRIRR